MAIFYIKDVRRTKALIAYSTRYGASAGTAEEIARILRQDNFDVRAIDLKR